MEQELVDFVNRVRIQLRDAGWNVEREPGDLTTLQVYDEASQHYIALSASPGLGPDDE